MGVRVKDEGQFKEIYVKALDSLPVGAEIDFDGDSADIPDGWEVVSGKSLVAYDLYNNASGSNGNITLSDNISNYKIIELVAVNNDDTTETFDTYRFDTSLSKFRLMGESVGTTSFNIFEKSYTKGVNQLIASQGKLYSGSTGSASNYEVFKIIKVIGYK